MLNGAAVGAAVARLQVAHEHAVAVLVLQLLQLEPRARRQLERTNEVALSFAPGINRPDNGANGWSRNGDGDESPRSEGWEGAGEGEGLIQVQC